MTGRSRPLRAGCRRATLARGTNNGICVEVPMLVKAVPDGGRARDVAGENIQRGDFNPLEEAAGLQRLIAEFKMTHEAVPRRDRTFAQASTVLQL